MLLPISGASRSTSSTSSPSHHLIGVDYAVNVMQRVLNGGGVIPRCAPPGRGGAYQLTTTLGYPRCSARRHQAVRSLGVIAVLGEVCCLAAAMLALPSWLMARPGAGERTSHVPSGAPRSPG
jgi:hypothetical protein